MSEKKHCCCCVPLQEGVVLVGIYGSSFHTALLIVQLSFGPTIMPHPDLLHPEAGTILEPVILLAHALGILVNLLLVIGAWRSKRGLIVPWLLVQGLLATILASMSLYCLVLYPMKSECLLLPSQPVSSLRYESDLIHPVYGTLVERTSQAPFNPGAGQCTILLWYSVVMVLSLLILIYYVYVVQEFYVQKLAESRERRKRKFPPPIPIIELIETPMRVIEDGIFVQELEDFSGNETTQQIISDTEESGSSKPPTGAVKRSQKPTVTFAENDLIQSS